MPSSCTISSSKPKLTLGACKECLSRDTVPESHGWREPRQHSTRSASCLFTSDLFVDSFPVEDKCPHMCRVSVSDEVAPSPGLLIASGLRGFALLLSPASFTGPDFSPPGRRAVVGVCQRVLPHIPCKSSQRKHPRCTKGEPRIPAEPSRLPTSHLTDASLAGSLPKPLTHSDVPVAIPSSCQISIRHVPRRCANTVLNVEQVNMETEWIRLPYKGAFSEEKGKVLPAAEAAKGPCACSLSVRRFAVGTRGGEANLPEST